MAVPDGTYTGTIHDRSADLFRREDGLVTLRMFKVDSPLKHYDCSADDDLVVYALAGWLGVTEQEAQAMLDDALGVSV